MSRVNVRTMQQAAKAAVNAYRSGVTPPAAVAVGIARAYIASQDSPSTRAELYRRLARVARLVNVCRGPFIMPTGAAASEAGAAKLERERSHLSGLMASVEEQTMHFSFGIIILANLFSKQLGLADASAPGAASGAGGTSASGGGWWRRHSSSRSLW
jgi:hypothetical protein